MAEAAGYREKLGTAYELGGVERLGAATGVYTVHVVLPLALGGAIYLLWRDPSMVLFRWVDLVGLSSVVDQFRSAFTSWRDVLPRWFFLSLPDALWVYALTSFMGMVWLGGSRMARRFWTAVGPALGIGSELGQLAVIVPGTFDVADLTLPCRPCSRAAQYEVAHGVARTPQGRSLTRTLLPEDGLRTRSASRVVDVAREGGLQVCDRIIGDAFERLPLLPRDGPIGEELLVVRAPTRRPGGGPAPGPREARAAPAAHCRSELWPPPGRPSDRVQPEAGVSWAEAP